MQIGALQTYSITLKSANNAVINSTTPLSNKRIARDEVLYADGTGLVDLAGLVKSTSNRFTEPIRHNISRSAGWNSAVRGKLARIQHQWPLSECADFAALLPAGGLTPHFRRRLAFRPRGDREEGVLGFVPAGDRERAYWFRPAGRDVYSNEHP
mgnify:CR=1 FL=1